MPTELGNLLIRVTSQGFDEVLQNLQNLESVMSRLGSNSALGRISQQLDQMTRYMKDMHGDLGQLALAQEKSGKAAEQQGRTFEETNKKLGAFEKTLQTLTKVYASFWAAAAPSRKFLNEMEQITAFNLSLTNMAMNANMARSALVTLGTAAEGFGGTKGEVASLGSRIEADVQGLRMGRDGGALMQVANTYGLDIRGSGAGGLGTQTEIMRNLAALFTRMGNSDLAQSQKLDIKRMLGIGDGTFKLLNEGVEAFDKEMVKAAKHQKEMASANEAAIRLAKKKAEAEQRWADMQLKMLEALEPFVDALYDIKKKIADWGVEKPGLAAAATAAGVGIGTVGAGYGAWQMVKGLLGFGGAKGAGGAAAGGGANVAGGAASGAGGIGRAVGGAGGWLGVGIQAANMVGTGIIAGKSFNISDSLHNISHILTAWFQTWLIQMVAKPGLKMNHDALVAQYEKALSNANLEKKTLDNVKGLAKLAARAHEITQQNEGVLLSGGRGKKNGQVGVEGVITIQKIDITVSSSSSNAEEVAKAVREELFRQINASIDDAMRRSRVA